MLSVKLLFRYPLKSAKGDSLETLNLSERGPELDRHWMVVNSSGKFLTQRQIPKLCLVETKVQAGQLVLSAPDMASLTVGRSNNRVRTKVWKDQLLASDCGDQVARWMSRFLGKDCRLVEMPESTKRLVDTDYAKHGETVSFADGFPLLVLSQASLDDFGEKLGQPIDAERFRPNIVVQGCAPYAEDSWQEIEIEGIRLSLVKPCSRCIIPSIDQATGAKEMQVNQALLKYRRRDGKTYFGQNALHRSVGSIAVGANVKVIQ